MRIALKIAWRTAAHSVARSLLISVLIALPIAGLAAVSIVGLSIEPTPAEKIATTLGSSEARITIVSPPDPGLTQIATIPEQWRNGAKFRSYDEPTRTISEIVPAGTRVISLFTSSAAVRTATGITTMQVTEGEPWDRSLRGHFFVLHGSTPQRPDEVMVNVSALDRLGVAIGANIEMRSPESKTMTVVGVLDDRATAASTPIIFGTTGSLTEAISAPERARQSEFYLPATVLDWAAVQKINESGATVLSRSVLLDPPPTTTGTATPTGTLPQLLLASLLLGGFTVFEVVLLAGAAFAVNMRAQQRTLAIVASVGGTRGTLFRIVSTSGIVLGAIGGILGIALGIGAAALVMHFTGDGSATRYYGFHVGWPILGAILIFASLVGWIAALAPAVTASRIDVVGALRGARRPPKSSRRRPLIGLIVIGTGFLITLAGGAGLIYFARQNRTITQDGGLSVSILVMAVVAGPIIAQLGIALCAPLLLRIIARFFNRGRLGGRLAARDAARNPARSVPAILTILTTVFLAVFVMSLVASFGAKDATTYSFNTTKGQVSSSLWYSSSNGLSIVRAEPEAYVAALTNNLDIESARVLSAVPDYNGIIYDDGTGGDATAADATAEPETASYPILTVPSANLCAMDPRSPGYRAVTTYEADRAIRDADPRCTRLEYLETGYSYGAHLWVGDAADLAQVLGRNPSAASTEALATGNAVALYPQYVANGQIEIDWWSAAQLKKGLGLQTAAPDAVSRVDAVTETPQHPIHFGVFISIATAERLGIDYSPALVLATPATSPTAAQMDAARSATSNLTADPAGTSLTIENGPVSQTALVAWILLVISAIIAIGASAVAIGLARFDGRRDDSVLSSLGASPVTRRSFAFWQSLIIVGLGSILGAALALLPTIALQMPGSGMPFAPPWLHIVGTALLLPLVVAAATWLFNRPPRQPGVVAG